MNTFTFFGEAMDGGGKLIGYGPIMTFTEGILTSKGWGASKAETLEQITNLQGVVDAIKQSKKITLMLSALRNEEHFNFKEQTTVPRFTLRIKDKGKPLKEIYFIDLFIDKIIPVVFQDKKMPGQGDRPIQYSKFSFNEVYMTVNGSVQIP